jgi:hypothetical protein
MTPSLDEMARGTAVGNILTNPYAEKPSCDLESFDVRFPPEGVVSGPTPSFAALMMCRKILSSRIETGRWNHQVPWEADFSAEKSFPLKKTFSFRPFC